MATPYYSQIIMSAQAVDETSSTILGPGLISRFIEHTFYVEWGTGVTAGVVQIETASHAAYAGTWAPLATVTYASGAPMGAVVQVTGALLAVRARISTAVADGTVTVTYLGVS